MEIPIPTSAPLPTSDLKDIERLVEFELRRAEDRRREFGWTPWALLVALAALLWQILDKSTGSLNWPTIGLIWAAAVFVWDFISFCGILLHKSSPGYSTPRYVSAEWALSGSRESILIDGFILFGACAIILGWGQLPQATWIAWLVITVIYSLQGPVGIALSYTDFDITTDLDGSRLVRFSGILRFAVNFASAAIALFAVWGAKVTLIDKENIKVATLLIVCSRVLCWLAEHRISAPRIELLEQIRRSIGLAELSSDAAQRAVDEALHGAQPGTLIRRHVLSFDENFRRMQLTQSSARDSLTSVSNSFSSQRISDAEIALTKAKLMTAASAISIAQLEELKKKIANRLAVVVVQNPKSAPELATAIKRVKEQSATAHSIQKALETDLVGAEGALIHLRKRSATDA